jgi:hypothetical protein
MISGGLGGLYCSLIDSSDSIMVVVMLGKVTVLIVLMVLIVVLIPRKLKSTKY